MSDASGGSIREVFWTFLKLGLTSFGGPIAHLGYFRDELVSRRKWIDDPDYADLVALCQFLPGPSSSQVGFALGLLRAGPLGALAAWFAFTLPSFVLLVAFAYGASQFSGPLGSGLISGLKIVAVAIVGQAVWGMTTALCPDRQRKTIALGALFMVFAASTAFGQMIAIFAGAIAGLFLCRQTGKPAVSQLKFPMSPTAGVVCLVSLLVLWIGLPIAVAATSSQELARFSIFVRAGSLVFGGGHVVLPILETEIVRNGWVTHDQFLAGYGAAQAVPGPLFTFASYLGTVMKGAPSGIIGAVAATVAIFLPGFLILIGAIPFWNRIRQADGVSAAMSGANAAVVGILGAALYDPIFISAVTDAPEFVLALVCFALLTVWKTPPWTVVAIAAFGGGILDSVTIMAPLR